MNAYPNVFWVTLYQHMASALTHVTLIIMLLRPEYSRQTISVLLLLMPLLLASPGHQQPWYRIWHIAKSLVFYEQWFRLPAPSQFRKHRKCIYIGIISVHNSVQQGLCQILTNIAQEVDGIGIHSAHFAQDSDVVWPLHLHSLTIVTHCPCW